MSQTIALLVDAYRELNSRRLFWIALILSGLVVAAFAAFGIDDSGFSILFWHFNSEMFNARIIKPDVVYKGMYTGFGIKFWLTWAATILALVSTAGIFPDMMSSGSIDLMLSKPIGRLRLFLTKFLTGLLFVTLQVSVFSVACVLVIGLRGGVWEPGLLLAIPLVVIFYSYLFAICVLIGVLTRSTIASLIITLILWLMIFFLHAAELLLLTARTSGEMRMEKLELSISRLEGNNPALLAPSSGAASTPTDPEGDDSAPDAGAAVDRRVQKRYDDFKNELAETRESHERWTMAHRLVFATKTLLPKTSETVELLERELIDIADLPKPPEADEEDVPPAFSERMSREDQERLQARLIEVTRQRSWLWIIGTSLAFEVIVLSLAAWRFCRRDF